MLTATQEQMQHYISGFRTGTVADFLFLSIIVCFCFCVAAFLQQARHIKELEKDLAEVMFILEENGLTGMDVDAEELEKAMNGRSHFFLYTDRMNPFEQG